MPHGYRATVHLPESPWQAGLLKRVLARLIVYVLKLSHPKCQVAHR